MVQESARYRVSARLQRIRELIQKSSGVTAYDLARALSVDRSTVVRSIAALRRAGVAIDESIADDGKTLVYRVRAESTRQGISLTLAQMISLAIVRDQLRILQGTGLDNDFNELCKRFELLIADPKYASAVGLDSRIFHVQGPQPAYDSVPAMMNEVIAGLFQNESLEIVTYKPEKGRRTLLIEPYSLLVYDKLLYLAGFSHEHGEIRTFAYDTIKSVKRRADLKFERPENYRPEQLVEGCFGIYSGPKLNVCVRFHADVARFVRRMLWHPTQTIAEVGGGAIELRMQVRGLPEVKKWVMSYGASAVVLGPVELRRAVRDEFRDVVLQYRSPALWEKKRREREQKRAALAARERESSR